ncbi:MAG TPA: gentisate 1,2-dioxygenase, partial [Burkholderiales bacterium]|nr:gentisate 1,2-dioxygenase [Burkholderiales bacterium]
MNEFKKDFQDMQWRFSDRSGLRARDENVYWTPIVVTKREIDAETERLASLPSPANGRRESLIVHPLAEANAPGFAPGIQVKLSVLKPGEKSAAFRHNATEVNFCIGGSGHT